MNQIAQYDCAIIGGGIAGLSLSILLARAGKSVILFEKENYPFHKVCGEYISYESVPFLDSIGLNISNRELPIMRNILLSAPSGLSIQRPLDIGGIGWSRYAMDNELYALALASGVTFCLQCKVLKVEFLNTLFEIQTALGTSMARVVAGAYGKNSNIDADLGRKTKARAKSKLFIGVKHHLRTDFDHSRVEIHNFDGGFCGLSAIEDGIVNLSYVCNAQKLKEYGNIKNLEIELLSQNPLLKNHFHHAEYLYAKPLTISHLQFGMRASVASNILMLGDAAGNISPLSGNGMSIGFQSSKLASVTILDYLNRLSTFSEMLRNYQESYAKQFTWRIGIAKQINASFGKPRLTNFGFRVLKAFPFLVDFMSKRIHGQEF